MNKESLAYELGVMLFNTDAKGMEDYDILGNFVGIFSAVSEEIKINDLRDGYIAEAENHDIPKDKAINMFEDLKLNIQELF
jgi:hypothetical protein